MSETSRVLILGGTGDATEFAHACARDLPWIQVVNSLAGRTASPRAAPGETHIGGFGGHAGLTRFITQQQISAVVDATHPYAARISAHAASACLEAGVSRLQFVRPGWKKTSVDHWIEAADLTAAAALIPGLGQRTFLSTGRQGLSAFSHLRDQWFLIRTVDPLSPPLPLPRCQAVSGRGPFSIDDEVNLLNEHRIDLLVSKNSGGDATHGKIRAAQMLSLPVIMLARPDPQIGPVAHDVADAVRWLDGLLGQR